MRWLLTRFWRSVAAIATLLGIIALPSDFWNGSEILRPYGLALSFLNRDTALWIFVVVLTGWLLWTDLKPSVQKWLASRSRPPIRCELYVSHRWLRWADKENIPPFRIYFYLELRNQMRPAKTLENVSVQHEMIGAPSNLMDREGAVSVDLRPGEHALFLIGTAIWPTALGYSEPGAGEELNEDDTFVAYHTIKSDNRTFLSAGQGVGSSTVYPPNVALSDIPSRLVVTANDVAPQAYHLHINLRELPATERAARLVAIDAEAPYQRLRMVPLGPPVQITPAPLQPENG